MAANISIYNVTVRGTTGLLSSKQINFKKIGAQVGLPTLTQGQFEEIGYLCKAHWLDTKTQSEAILEQPNNGYIFLNNSKDLIEVEPDLEITFNAMAFKNALIEAVKSDPTFPNVPGKGKKGYGSYFSSGIIPGQPIPMKGMRRTDIVPFSLSVPAQPGKGKQGVGQRVTKIFPQLVKGWEAQFPLTVTHSIITSLLLEQAIEYAGRYVGLGAMRIGNGGISGGFELISCELNQSI